MPPKVIGLTGSIGSGKSAVLSMFAEMGFPCSDADQLARQAVEPGTPGHQEIVEAFGPQVLLAPGGALDRPKLGAIVFADPAAREKLERIIHPKVRDAQERFARDRADAPLVILDIPLLFESGSQSLCDHVVTVVVDEETRRERLGKRADRLSPAEVERRLRAQMPQSEKIARSDAVIDNSGSLEETRRQVQELVRRWLAESPNEQTP
jgi:dephospho-CoA kinase